MSTSTDTHQRVPTTADTSGDFLSSLSSMGRDNSPIFNESHVDNNKYGIDPENPGLLLIINQEIFYTEIDEKFKVRRFYKNILFVYGTKLVVMYICKF